VAFTKTAWNDNALPALTAAQLNRMEQGIADAFPHSRTAHAVMARANSVKQITSGGWNWIDGYDTTVEEDIPTGLTSAVDLANGRLYARADGLYVAAFSAYWAASANGRRLFAIAKSASATAIHCVVPVQDRVVRSLMSRLQSCRAPSS
jgi:hypothetical protein